MLVLAAAGFHAGWNRLLHDTPDRLAAMAVGGLVGGCVLLPAAAMAPPLEVLPLVGLSAVAEVGYALCLSAAYSRGALSLAYPIGRGTAPLLVTLGGWIVLAERPTPGTVAGAIALACGLAIVATAGQVTSRGPAVAFALLTGASIATYSLIDGRAVRHASPPAYLAAVLLLQGLLLLGPLRGNVPRLRAAWRPGLGVAAGSTAAYLLVLLAFQRSGTGRVATLREVSVLIGLLLARDRPGRQAWAGAILVLGGMVLAAAE